MTPPELRTVDGGKGRDPSPPPPPRMAAFQPDASALVQQQPRSPARLVLYAAAGLIVTAVAWAALSQVDRVVVATGRLTATTPNLVVQPLETSVIRGLNVAPGDVVRAGQTLATLDPTFAAADLAQLRGRLSARGALAARLEAELDGRDYAPGPGADAEERLQAAAFAQRSAFRRARLAEFDARIASTQASIQTSQRDQEVMAVRLDVLRELEGIRTQLLATQTGSRVTLLETRSSRLDLEGRLERQRANLDELAHDVLRIQAERRAFLEDLRQQMFEELVRVRAERDASQEELAKAELRRSMVVLTAPTDAVVLEVAARSVGSVVREAEALFTLVPTDAVLEAELTIAPADVGRLAVGQRVRLKLDAFPYQEHGSTDGHLRTISEGAFPRDRENGGETAYRGRVAFEDVALRGVPAPVRLMPGMTLVGEVQVGRRNLLAYFAYPLLRGLDESLREP
ncbi:HlyD family type I secretion periplasmic adaptor subunit [Roseomonas terrae]|jgi:hemolysin D|uniref:Membrane fusion protein (MFP) family protein n=1 Tax=Neoroseomonas terrae TaxID=424799 RepID=A0ABS5EKE4_9PROT|nr:HlyD family type I secretion periplasmic adaptor subunit [Neoroseomonas terrae]MBR0651499.1 HlyD family type I secretion periplasmic adaptor subunit [Neoroseomonas terrae]